MRSEEGGKGPPVLRIHCVKIKRHDRESINPTCSVQQWEKDFDELILHETPGCVTEGSESLRKTGE